jgi:serine/threonine protein kinase
MPARYRKLRKIADGGMAELFLAIQQGAEGFERRVVLKQILAPLLADPKFRNMLIDEAHVAMSLHHSNIAQVLDLGQWKGRTFLVLELVDGWDLNHLLARVRASGVALPPELALYVCAEVCRALAYAHAQARDGRPLGIVHRDISPHNVLISEEGEVKLTDFGIAKAMGRREHTGQGIIKGKLAFMSPEQASGEELDARSDLFSVGTMLYLLFTGRRPFEAPTDLEIVLRVRQCSFKPPAEIKPDLPPAIAKLIERSMARDRDARYQTGEEMLLDLEGAQRAVFGPAGQTELRRWLREIKQKDSAPPISQAPALPSEHEDEMDIEDEDIVFEGPGSDIPTVASAGSGPRRTKTAPSLVMAARAIGEAAAAQAPNPPGEGQPRREATGTSSAPRLDPLLEDAARRRWLLGGLLGGAVVGVAALRFALPRLIGEPAPPPPMPPRAAPPPPVAKPAPEVPVLPVVPPDARARADAAASPAAVPSGAVDAGRDGSRSDVDSDEEDEEELLRHREPDAADTVIGEEAAAPPRPGTPRQAPAKKTAAPKPPPAPSYVRITSRPDGAVVKLGSRVFGRAPLNLRFNPGVTYELAFVKSGYVTARKRFTVSTKTNQQLTVTLKKKAVKRKSFFQRLFGR